LTARARSPQPAARGQHELPPLTFALVDATFFNHHRIALAASARLAQISISSTKVPDSDSPAFLQWHGIAKRSEHRNLRCDAGLAQIAPFSHENFVLMLPGDT
jgi:hypothetical protein